MRKPDNKHEILFNCIKKGDVNFVKKFLNENSKDPNLLKCQDAQKRSPLHVAVMCLFFIQIKIFLDK